MIKEKVESKPDEYYLLTVNDHTLGAGTMPYLLDALEIYLSGLQSYDNVNIQFTASNKSEKEQK